MCGAVSFTARDVPDRMGACHCEMCRRWTGSALLGVTVPEAGTEWRGTDDIATLQSSDWAERAWCRKCGTGLYFRVTADNEWAGSFEIPLGLFDDPNGFTMTNEIYIDHKPDSFAYADEGRDLMTRAEYVAKFSMLGQD